MHLLLHCVVSIAVVGLDTIVILYNKTSLQRTYGSKQKLSLHFYIPFQMQLSIWTANCRMSWFTDTIAVLRRPLRLKVEVKNYTAASKLLFILLQKKNYQQRQCTTRLQLVSQTFTLDKDLNLYIDSPGLLYKVAILVSLSIF